MRPTGGKYPDLAPAPFRPPLAATRPCIKCTQPFQFKGKERVCIECKGKGHRKANLRWSATRSEMTRMLRRIESLEAFVNEMNARLCGCRVRQARKEAQ